MEFPTVDKTTWFYKNCKRQRKNNAKICSVCPFQFGIEDQEGYHTGGFVDLKKNPELGRIKGCND